MVTGISGLSRDWCSLEKLNSTDRNFVNFSSMTTGRLDYKPGNFLRYFNGIKHVATKHAEP